MIRLIVGGILALVGAAVVATGTAQGQPVYIGVGFMFAVLGLFVAVSGGRQ